MVVPPRPIPNAVVQRVCVTAIRFVVLCGLLSASFRGFAQDQSSSVGIQESSDEKVQNRANVDESFFTDTLYPAMRQSQCQDCHNDNGVASDTLLEFPAEYAGQERVLAFGFEMMDLVDFDDPEQSMLLLMPTNREEHTGGQRIKPGSVQEKQLRTWIKYLASFSGQQQREARDRIARAKTRQISRLAVRRLTHSQYNNTVRDLIADQTRPANRFPKEDFVHGFKNQVDGQQVSPLQAEAYSKAAERLAIAAFRGGDHLGLLPRTPESNSDRDCATEFVRRFGLKAFRRPLNEHEVATYTDLLLIDAAASQDFLAGARMVVETMLQSPHFLFRIERGPGNELESYERASRLSYLLWDTMPNADLLTAAAVGQLSTPDQMESWARRMLDDPRAKQAMDEFLSQWLRFDRVIGATRDRRQFGAFNSDLASAMVEETRRLFHHIVDDNRSFLELYTADYTFLNGPLAEIYGLPSPTEEFAKVSYPSDSGRGGLLGHASFLVATSKPSETSPTARGLFVRSQLLSHEVPAPPPGVTAELPEITQDSPMTNRQRLDIHLNSEACASCHRLIDPIGLGLEQYDPLGAYHEKMIVRVGGRRDAKTIELDLDTHAYIQGIEDSKFSSPKELGQILAGSEAGQRAIVKQLFRYAFGRQETPDDKPDIDAMAKRFRESGFRFRELIIALVTSPLFLQET